MIDPREWAAAAVLSTVIGAVLAVAGAPGAAYWIAAVLFLAGIWLYQRRTR